MSNITQEIITKFKNFINKLFKKNNEDFFCFLPHKLGKISSFLLHHVFSKIKMEKEQINIIRKIPDNAIIIFVTKHKSNFELLFSYIRHKELLLPVPQIAFDYNIYLFQPFIRILKIFLSHLNYIIKNRKLINPYQNNQYEKKLLISKCAFLSLVERKDFYQRFVKKREDPINYIINIQKKITSPIYIIPQIMFFDKKPLSSEPSIKDIIFGNSQQPGIIRKIATLIQSPKKIFIEFSQPLNLQHWINLPDNKKIKQTKSQALLLRRDLLLQHNKHRHAITGPTIKSKEEVKEAILTNRRMQKFMKKYVQDKKLSLHKINKKANSYMDEIAARYNIGSINIMSHIINWIINSMFDGAVIDKIGLNKIKKASKKGPLILMPCHKSHIDYLILSYILYNNNMPCPHVAAGKNLSFWPLGTIFRSGGAFFIRRSFKGQKLYAKVFSEYVYKLLEEGFNIEIFIEGGRSRTGKLLNPKLGLISILIEAYKSGACEDMIFVPVYIGYDRIIEEYAYLHEIEGGNKSPESFLQILKARKFLKKRYGKIYVNFHDPIFVKNLLNIKNKNTNIYSHIGKQIITAINKETIITPHGLTAAAILNIPRQRFTFDEIINIANSYLFFLIEQNTKISDTLTINPNKALKNAIIEYKHRKILEEVTNDKNNILNKKIYIVKNNKRSLLEFYKNNCISHFIHGSATALSILAKNAFQFSAFDLHKQHNLILTHFKYEFAIDFESDLELIIAKVIKIFVDDAMLMPHKTIPDTYNITSLGYQKLKLYATFLKPYFESYMVVLQYIIQSKKHLLKMETKERLKKIQSMGIQMYKKGEIDLVESISKSNYSNGLKLFNELNINKNINNNKIKNYYDNIIENLKLINN